MPASDSFVGEGLTPSPYSELSTKYEVLERRNFWLSAENNMALALAEEKLKAFAAGYEELSTKYEVLSAFTERLVANLDTHWHEEAIAEYRALRTKYCG